uniref:Uncharacterized protein n=1 Tax=Steinernema glaseri TaxID=37863 RepID=A0A1I7ZYV5_9BILA
MFFNHFFIVRPFALEAHKDAGSTKGPDLREEDLMEAKCGTFWRSDYARCPIRKGEDQQGPARIAGIQQSEQIPGVTIVAHPDR